MIEIISLDMYFHMVEPIMNKLNIDFYFHMFEIIATFKFFSLMVETFKSGSQTFILPI